MMIKTLKLFLLTTLIFITGCNGDVFVDDFLPGGHEEITISENDNIKEINFKSDNWNLYNVVCEKDYLFANAYTLDGELTHLPFDEKELGTVHYTSDYIDFYVEKVSGNKLKVTLNENLHNENAELLIIVGNEYKQEYIKMVLAPTSKYQIDSVVYDWGKFEIYEGNLKEMENLIVYNKFSSSPVTIKVYPFRKSTHEISFYDPTLTWDKEVFSRLFGIPLPEIIIPDIVDSKPVLNETKVTFGIRNQQLKTDLDKELFVDVTIDGFDNRKISVFNLVRIYTVPYSIYLSNAKTGKHRIFKGVLHSEEPIDYLILKQVLDEN
ncbi:MAG: hypothetical protein GX670_05990 [Bacteroidales bacterium]|nr:hypothetical protein [Bacteroidales bacterium]